MKLTSLLTAALVPLALMAAPVIEETADVVARDMNDVKQVCAIVGASVVNCRAGPGTNYRVVGTFKKGDVGWFSCVKSGVCVTVGGSTNW